MCKLFKAKAQHTNPSYYRNKLSNQIKLHIKIQTSISHEKVLISLNSVLIERKYNSSVNLLMHILK